MKLRAWFKSKTADKALSPLREMIIDHIDDHSDVLEVGCGTGDLLFRAADKIRAGTGVDLDRHMIDFATRRKTIEQKNNLDFVRDNIASSTGFAGRSFDVATTTLCLHEMSENEAIDTLKLFRQLSSKIIIADFAPPETLWGKASIEMDELFSGHYKRFTHYRSRGGFPSLATAAGLETDGGIKSPIDGIRIWVISVA